MVDVFEEVEDQIRTERYKSLVLKVLPWAIGAAVIALAAALGYWAWTSNQTKQADKAAEQYVAALETAGKGDQAKAFTAFGEVAKSSDKTYAALALLMQGGIRQEEGKAAEAVKLYDQAAAATSEPLIADLARLKSALALLDTAPYKDIEGRLTPLLEEKRPYRLQAREALAFAKLLAGRTAEARTDFSGLSTVLGASEGMRQRAQAAMGLIDSGSAAALPAAVKAAIAMPEAPPQVLPPALSPAPQAQQGPAQ